MNATSPTTSPGNKPSHTPGPWRVEQFRERWLILAPAGHPAPLATVHSDYDHLRATSPANAALIAAAPRMLDALRVARLALRGNPGGYLSGAVNVSSLWLNQGQTVVSERRGSTVIDTETATGTNTLKGLPTIVLIDGGSASASEITAGALHDNHDATLVGVQSFGKGSVQEVENLPDGSEVKITIAHWNTPDGVNINKKGLTPDTVISNNGAATGTDPQLDKANALVQAQIGS